MEELVIHGTMRLVKAISDDPENILTTAARLEWDNDERKAVYEIVSRIAPNDDVVCGRFSRKLASILISTAYSLKYPLRNARRDPERPLSPGEDVSLLGSAIEKLQSAADDIERLSIPYGLRTGVAPVHSTILNCIELAKTARAQLKAAYPHEVRGQRRVDKQIKIHLATQIAQALIKQLRYRPTSTNDGPYHRLFVLCTVYLGISGGRWGDYYRPAFDKLGLRRSAQPPRKTK